MATSIYKNFAGDSGRRGFPSPWDDEASRHMPDTHHRALEWCERLYLRHSTYRAARQRTTSYFLTEPEVAAASTDERLGESEKQQWLSLLGETLNIREATRALDEDFDCYGNAFASLVVPFNRYLASPGGLVLPFKKVADNPSFGLRWEPKANKFTAVDPSLKRRVPWRIKDLQGDLAREISIKQWSPHDIDIRFDEYTCKTSYVWRIPQRYRRSLQENDLYQLERAPQGILAAVAKGTNFRFNEGVIFHLKQPTLAGVYNAGWGLPNILLNYREIFHLQLLLRTNESLARDYLVPIRLVTPAARSVGSAVTGGSNADPLLNVHGAEFRQFFRGMVREHRRDPTSWHGMPFPIDYHLLGGEASSLVPSEMLMNAEDRLLNATHTPPELYRGTLQLQTAPVSLRLFEATHTTLVAGNNRFLQWVVDRAVRLLGYSPVRAKFTRVTQVDDLNRDMAIMQLHASQLVSGQTAFKRLNLDYFDELEQMADEMRKQEQVAARMQEESEQAAIGQEIARGQMTVGSPPGGAALAGAAGAAGTAGTAGPAGAAGAPAAATGPGGMPSGGVAAMDFTNMSVEDMHAYAESLANELLSYGETQRISELRSLADKNETVHALVKQKIENIRSRAQSAGGAMLLGQQPAGAS